MSRRSWAPSAVLLWAAAASGVAWAAPADKVVLQDLAARGVSAVDAAALTTATCTALAAQPALELLCGDELRALMQWNALASGLDRCRDEACAAGVARALQAQRLVTGQVAQVGPELVLSLALVDAQTGEVRGRAEARAPTLVALHQQLEATARALLTPPKAVAPSTPSR